MVSRMLYQVHTWSWNPEGSFDVLQNAFKDMIAPLVRPYLGGLEAFLFTASELAGFLSILDPCTQARINRLKFLARALQHIPEGIWQLIDATDHEKDWAHACCADCRWLRTHFQKGRWPDDTATFAEWRQFVASTGDRMARVKMGEKVAIRFHERSALAKRWSLSMERNYAEQGLLFHSREQRPAVDAFICDQCSKAFASKRGLYMHSTHVHGYKPQVRFWATGSVRLKCSKEYHSRHRLMQHLRNSDACLLHLVDTFPPLSDEQ